MKTHQTTGHSVVAAVALVAVALVGCEAMAPRGQCAWRDARPSGAPDWVLVGNAADRDGFFEVTPNDFNQRGAAWQQEPVDLRQSFDRTFQLSFGSDDAGADGIVFVLQGVGTDALGAFGQGLGYQ